VDPNAAALSFASSCFLSAYQHHMLGPSGRRKLPSLEAAITTLADLLDATAAGPAQTHGTNR
jgi:hypothetical protein